MAVFLLFCLGLLLLVLGAKLFVESSEKIARYHGVSEVVIGIIIIGCGTSLPELFISSTASATGHGSVALANVIGSNIANIALIGGLLMMMLGLLPSHDFGKKDLIFFVLSNTLLLAGVGFSWRGGVPGVVSGGTSFVLLCFLCYYLWSESHVHRTSSATKHLNRPSKQDWLLGGGGFLLLLGGSQLAVHYLSPLALSLGVSEYVVGVLLVAVGTSLPELVTSIIALTAGSRDIAFGNIIGSNIFNAFGVLGIASLFGTISFDQHYLVDGMMMALCALILIVTLRAKPLQHTIVRGLGVLLLLMYGGYVWWMMG